MSVLRIFCNNIFPKDAVGNFCLDFYALCQKNNIAATMYAEGFDKSFADDINPATKIMEDCQKNDRLFFFYSIYDPYFKKIIELPCKEKLSYFHGITKPEFFIDFNKELVAYCKKGYEELTLLTHFDKWAANSYATAKILNNHVPQINLEQIAVIPPKLIQENYIQPKEVVVKKPAKLLYVGRLKSHKKVDDLLIFFTEYLKWDSQAECLLVGGQEDESYMRFLKKIIATFDPSVGERIKWLGMVEEAKLKQLYNEASAYISMSEDEGFCLPLLEAMLHGLPVFAYGIPAVLEVLQSSAGCFTQKNYPELAQFIYETLHNKNKLQSLITHQCKQAFTLINKMDGKALLEFVQG